MRNRILTDQYYEGPTTASSKAKVRAKLKSKWSRCIGANDLHHNAGIFQCAHCRGFVSTDPLLSGVNNRNHCPYCLWSRHLDLHQAGDRLAACKGSMQPVGLTEKRIRKKYGQGRSGELMLIHLCLECGKLSINRTAADDDVGLILGIFEGSFLIDPELRKRCEGSGIQVLGAADVELVSARLIGWNASEPSESSLLRSF